MRSLDVEGEASRGGRTEERHEARAGRGGARARLTLATEAVRPMIADMFVFKMEFETKPPSYRHKDARRVA